MLWVEVVNRALEWDGVGSAREPHPQAGAPIDPLASTARRRDVGLLRRVIAVRLLDHRLEAEAENALSQWLAAVTLQPSGAAATAQGWPDFVARRPLSELGDPFESLLSTSLLQVLALPRDSFGTVVHRCHGLVRGAAPESGWPVDGEKRFAAQAELGAFLPAASLHQCPRLVWSHRGSRYCSKACSNSSFAARKAQQEPRYFAAKQGRYRARRQRAQAARPRRSAFVYMD